MVGDLVDLGDLVKLPLQVGEVGGEGRIHHVHHLGLQVLRLGGPLVLLLLRDLEAVPIIYM